MAITGISERVASTLKHMHGFDSDVATKALVRELGSELFELAEAVERLSVQVDRLVEDRRGRGSAQD